tara:strand:+ start:285 stop:527 length:243 start_codon:yes stop_codon:yes gene_type:complete
MDPLEILIKKESLVNKDRMIPLWLGEEISILAIALENLVEVFEPKNKKEYDELFGGFGSSMDPLRQEQYMEEKKRRKRND